MARAALLLPSLLLLASPAGATALDDVLGPRCTVDARLAPVAEAARADPETFDPLELRELAHAQHVAAPTVQTLVLRGDADALPVVAGRWLAERNASPALSRCAVAVGEGTLALVMVPRLLEPRALPANGNVRAWQVALPAGVTEAALMATAPNGAVTRHALSADGTGSLALDRDGAWTLQVLATFPSGPMPVALWEERVGEGAAVAPAVDGSITNDRHLMRAINGLRRERGLPALRRDPLLDLVALAHARRLAASGTVAHTPAPGDTPVDRLRAAGVTADRVAENLARARSLAVAHARIARSPAHRANLLDAAVDAVGVGVAHAGGMAYVVELLATRPTLVGR